MSSRRVLKTSLSVAGVAFLSLLLSLSWLPAVCAQWTGGHDVVGCREASDVWYFAEGCTRSGFNEWLCLQNPSIGPITAELTFMQNDGVVTSENKTLAPKSRTTVNVGAVIDPEKDVSVKIESPEPIIAERPMYFHYKWMWTGGHNEMGVTSPGDTWYFAEGHTGDGFEEWICIQNPGDTDAAVSIVYFNNQGQMENSAFLVPARSRHTVSVNDDCSFNGDVSVSVQSDREIICERPMYFNYRGKWPGGHIISGAKEARQRWYFAEGTTRESFEEWICILNPSPDPASVSLTYMIQGGEPMRQDLEVGAASRATVYPADFVGLDKDISVALKSTRPVIAERPMYFNYNGYCPGGHCVLGAEAGGTDWYFAEGCTRPGFEEYLCLQNPGKEMADISLTFMGQGGDFFVNGMTVAGKSRLTVKVNDVIGQDQDVSVAVSSDRNIIVERPMYFSYSPQPPSVSSISPNSAETGQAVGVNIAGRNFQPGASAYLNGNNYPDIVGQGTAVVSGQAITSTFDLSGAPAGAYNVLVVNPDGPAGQLAGGFTVTAPEPPPPPPPPTPTGLIVLDHTSYTDSINYLHIVGEVQNTTSSNIQFGKIVATIYDSSGGVIDTDFTYTDLNIMAPTEKSPFHMISEMPPGFGSYTLQTDYDTTAQGPDRSLTILSQSSFTDSIGYLHIVGEVRNDSGHNIQFCEIVGTMYNSAGRVVDTDFTYAELDTLSPGQLSPFEMLISSERAPLVHHWTLYTQFDVI